jgi:hypothetical protein
VVGAAVVDHVFTRAWTSAGDRIQPHPADGWVDVVPEDRFDLKLGCVGVDLPLPPLLGVRLRGLLTRRRVGPLPDDDAGRLFVEPVLGIPLELEQPRVLLARSVPVARLVATAGMPQPTTLAKGHFAKPSRGVAMLQQATSGRAFSAARGLFRLRLRQHQSAAQRRGRRARSR